MSVVDLVKKPARVKLPSCPAWCVRDHTGDLDWRAQHSGTWLYSSQAPGFSVSPFWVEIRGAVRQDHVFARMNRAGVTLADDAGGLDLSPEDATSLARMLAYLGRGEEARLVRDAAAQIAGLGGAK